MCKIVTFLFRILQKRRCHFFQLPWRLMLSLMGYLPEINIKNDKYKAYLTFDIINNENMMFTVVFRSVHFFVSGFNTPTCSLGDSIVCLKKYKYFLK